MARTKLRKIRGNRSQEEVALQLGITRQMLGAIETGQRNPSLEVAKRIAEFYNVSIDEIFFEEDGNESEPNPTGTCG